jgi:single-strand DNA-binding protein
MANVNKAIVVGRLGQDPELRNTKSGTAVCNFSVATNRYKKGGEKGETDWHNVTAWDRTAENCKEYLRKGSEVYVEGRMELQTWEDKEGVERQKTVIVAYNVQFMARPKDEQEAPKRERSKKDDNDPWGNDNPPF